MDRKIILIADDDAAFLRALSVRLEAEGYTVVEAQDTVQAVSAARRHAPDLLILDVNMPAGDGFTAQELIQAIEELHDVPVIYLTGERSTRASYGSAEMGARALLYKPLDTDRFLVAVAEILGTSQSTTQRALDDLRRAADEWSAAATTSNGGAR